MVLGYLVVAVVAAAVAVFAAQNGAPVSVRFVAWTLGDVSVAALALVSLAVGLLVAGVPLGLARWRARARVRAAEAKVRQLEAALADRDRALLARHPPAASG